VLSGVQATDDRWSVSTGIGNAEGISEAVARE
jgi:hypothetical protein